MHRICRVQLQLTHSLIHALTVDAIASKESSGQHGQFDNATADSQGLIYLHVSSRLALCRLNRLTINRLNRYQLSVSLNKESIWMNPCCTNEHSPEDKLSIFKSNETSTWSSSGGAVMTKHHKLQNCCLTLLDTVT